MPKEINTPGNQSNQEIAYAKIKYRIYDRSVCVFVLANLIPPSFSFSLFLLRKKIIEGEVVGVL